MFFIIIIIITIMIIIVIVIVIIIIILIIIVIITVIIIIVIIVIIICFMFPLPLRNSNLSLTIWMTTLEERGWWYEFTSDLEPLKVCSGVEKNNVLKKWFLLHVTNCKFVCFLLGYCSVFFEMSHLIARIDPWASSHIEPCPFSPCLWDSCLWIFEILTTKSPKKQKRSTFW